MCARRLAEGERDKISGTVRCAVRCELRPAQMFLGWRQVIQVSPRWGEGTPPYRLFYCSLLTTKCSVGNGLDRSGAVLYPLQWDLAQGPLTGRRGRRPLQICFYLISKLSLSQNLYYLKFLRFLLFKEGTKSPVKPHSTFKMVTLTGASSMALRQAGPKGSAAARVPSHR